MTAMRRVLRIIAIAALACATGGNAAAPGRTLNDRLTGDLAPTHDPVIAREGDTYYVFGTGLSSRTSKDLAHWTAGKPLVDNVLPDWATKAVPGAKGMWAPDIAFVNGRWRLYYAGSTFGSNRSVIGLLTSPTLDPAAPGYAWRDDGLVVMSTRDSDFNAIDADVAGGNIDVRADMPIELGHETLAEAHDLMVALSLRIEVRATFAAAHG